MTKKIETVRELLEASRVLLNGNLSRHEAFKLCGKVHGARRRSKRLYLEHPATEEEKEAFNLLCVGRFDFDGLKFENLKYSDKKALLDIVLEGTNLDEILPLRLNSLNAFSMFDEELTVQENYVDNKNYGA